MPAQYHPVLERQIADEIGLDMVAGGCKRNCTAPIRMSASSKVAATAILMGDMEPRYGLTVAPNRLTKFYHTWPVCQWGRVGTSEVPTLWMLTRPTGASGRRASTNCGGSTLDCGRAFNNGGGRRFFLLRQLVGSLIDPQHTTDDQHHRAEHFPESGVVA